MASKQHLAFACNANAEMKQGQEDTWINDLERNGVSLLDYLDEEAQETKWEGLNVPDYPIAAKYMKYPEEYIPMVNAAMFHIYGFRTVSIVGKVKCNETYRGVFIDAEGTEFRVNLDIKHRVMYMGKMRHLNIPTHFKSKYICWEGVIDENYVLQPIEFKEWGNNLSLSTWNKVMKLTHQFPNLF